MEMPLLNEDVSVVTEEFDKFGESIQKFGESIESWNELTQLDTLEQQNDHHAHRHHALEPEGVAERIVSIGQTIAEISDLIDDLDPSNIRNDELELFASVKAIEPTKAMEDATPSNDTVEDEDDDDEDLYNSGEILDERATEQSTETHLEGNGTDNVSSISTRVNELSIDNSQPSTEQVEPKVTDSSDGSAAAEVDDDDDEEDLYSDCLTPPMPLDANDRTYDDTDFSTAETSPLGATSNPGVCPSMLTSGPDADFVTMPTEVNDPTRCLSYPVLQPEKDLARCICGEESGFDELRNEEGTLVGVQCRSCFGAWLTAEVAPKSNRMKITREGRKFYLNAPIHLNTTKLDTSPVSDTSELRRGDHIMLDRGVYIHHAIVVGVTSPGIKLMHWQYETPKIEPRIVYETKSAEELAGVSKVLYAKEDPVELVIARAAWAKVHGGEEYHISENNCESFATFCKTGHYVSLEGKVMRKFFPRIIRVFEYFFGQRQNPNEVHAVSRSTPDLRSID